MRPRIVIYPNQAEGTFVVRLEGDPTLAEVGSYLDAERIARGISAWTHLPLFEAPSA